MPLREQLERHVVRINQDGFAIRPDISLFGHKEKFFDELLSRPVFEEKIDKMLACAERLADSKIADKSKRRNVKLLIHVHGGLNFFADTDDRVTTLGPAIQHDGEDWYYPIFVSWPSSALGTFGEHLWSIRGGRKVSPVHGAISLPFVLVSDLLQVGNVVTSMYLQAERVTNEIALNTSLSREGAPHSWLKVTQDGLPTAWRKARSNHDQLQNSRSIQAPATYWSGYYYPDSLALSTDYIGRL